jgi:hypothetical protein
VFRHTSCSRTLCRCPLCCTHMHCPAAMASWAPLEALRSYWLFRDRLMPIPLRPLAAPPPRGSNTCAIKIDPPGACCFRDQARPSSPPTGARGRGERAHLAAASKGVAWRCRRLTALNRYHWRPA